MEIEKKTEEIVRRGRGHDNYGDLFERYKGARFQVLNPHAKPGPIASAEGWVIFIVGLHEEAMEDSVNDVFAEFGEIINMYINLDRQSGFVKGYAFLEYREESQAAAAIQAMNGQEFLGKLLHVDWAFKKNPPSRTKKRNQ
uniref:RRM domain-containing protein n=1 Tax=Polytomella parva TaxID=51329 RepID=A0A7S0UJ90_9CHLO|mmetsp:Transcript_11155/g.20178  ORF Transcript_11155/g.20178 Transcript_11155/m.20178 type:complete len:141 (+) Transcript_11155:133-555(+)